MPIICKNPIRYSKEYEDEEMEIYKPYKQCECFMIAFNEEKPKKTVVTISQTSDSGKNDITLVLT